MLQVPEPVASIGNPPAHINDGNGRGQTPPDAQLEVGYGAQHAKEDPENLLLHAFILVLGLLSRLFFPAPNIYKGAMSSTVRAVSEAVHARVVGDGEVVLSRISSIESPPPGIWSLSKMKRT